MSYPNGQVPFSVLVHLGANFWLPPGTAARWRWFVREGQRRFGVTFRITPDRDSLGGWNAYRPLSAQILYRKHYGNMAAVAGFSSHGGFYRGQEVFAIDVDNWSAVRWADFVQLCREAGFRTDFVVPQERWHIGDFNNPWVIPAFAADPTPTPTPNRPLEDDEMLMLNLTGIGNATHKVALGNGIFRHFIGTDPYEKIKNVSRIQDDWQDITYAELPAFLRTYGCDLQIWDWRPNEGGFVVLDPLTNKAIPGGMWSAQNAARAAIAGIKVQTVDPAPVVAAVEKALAKGVNLDEESIAKAVRAEFKNNPLS